MAAKRFTRYLLLLCTFSMPAFSDLVNDAKQRASKIELSDSLTETVRRLDESAGESQAKIQLMINNSNLKNAINNHKARLEQRLGLATNEPEERGSSGGEKTFILFASSAIPLTTLRHYAADLVKINGVMVFKGLIDQPDKLTPTIDFFRKIMVVDEECTDSTCDVLPLKAAIDPKRFEQHGIEQVPAGLMEEKPSFEPQCNQSVPYEVRSETIFGDASVVAMLQALDPHQQDESIQHMIKRLEGSVHETR